MTPTLPHDWCRKTRISLSDDVAQLDILPERGAAIARYELLDEDSSHPLFQPAAFGQAGEAEDIAAIVLIPWSNRISGGGFQYERRFVPLLPNMDGEPYPIHGNAFQSAWRLAAMERTAARLELDSPGPSEFRYTATIAYGLSGGRLRVDLSLTNCSERALPFGLGFHPWFPRTPNLTLRFNAVDVWLEDERHLPAGRLEIADAGRWDFSRARRLPESWINNGFGGWDGQAEIMWPERGIGLRISAAPSLGHCIVYSPHGAAPFFCFEPVSHAVDAHNQARPEASGLTRLAPGEAMSAWCLFDPFTPGEPGNRESVQ